MPQIVRLLRFLMFGLPLAVCCSAANAQLEQLANRVPESANALVVVNVKSAYSSPLARAQNWGQQGPDAHRAGMIALPSSAEKFLMAAEMDYEFMQPKWEVAVAFGSQLPEVEEIATRSNGRLDRLAGAKAVERPNDSMIVKLGPKIIGAMAPANRQHVSRWIRNSRRRKSPELSPYLTDSLKKASEPDSHIVLALDLEGLLDPAEVAGKLSQIDAILDSNAKVATYSEILASLRGVRLEVQLLSSPRGMLSLDFAQDAEILSGFAKPLLLDVLARNGIGMDDIQGWAVSPQGNSIAFEGELSHNGLRRVLSVLSSPVGPMATSSKSSESTQDAIADRSQRYFQAVTDYLNDLFFGDRRPQNLQQAKIWIERYAHKITDLDRYQVDKEVVAFGQDAVASLHEIVGILDRTNLRIDLRDANLYNSGRQRYGRYGPYGYFEKAYVTRDRELIQADEGTRGLRNAQVLVDELRQLSAETRQTMTERYQRPF